MHAVLCLSSQHLSNKARVQNNHVDTKRYREISAQNRSQALHLLRVAAANDQPDVGVEILPAIMILLILAAVRSVIWSFLTTDDQGRDCNHSFLPRADFQAARSSRHPNGLDFRPYDIWPTFPLHRSVLAQCSEAARYPIAILESRYSALLGRESRSRHGKCRWNGETTLIRILANPQSREVFMLLLQANSMVLEYKEITRALVRTKDDAELSMMRLVVQARASAMEADMEDEDGWLHHYSKDCLGG